MSDAFCIGQEMLPASLNLVLKKDSVFCGHRSHGYYLSKNGSLKIYLQSFMEKQEFQVSGHKSLCQKT